MLSHNVFIRSSALKIPLILPNSPESPLYIKNITRAQMIENLRRRSKIRARSISRSRTSNNTHNKFAQPDWVSKQPLHVEEGSVISLKIGIGTFTTPISYKPYYLYLDTGSELIWVQCEDCRRLGNRCFGKPPKFFKNSESSSYHPIPCGTHEFCYLSTCINGFCSYTKQYDDGSAARGILAFETFTLDTEGVVFNLAFGCNFFFYGRVTDVGNGILGLGWGKRSFISQIKTQVHDAFSYCFPHFDKTSSAQSHGYFAIGSDVVFDDDYSYTTMVTVGGEQHYYLNLVGISVNGNRLRISARVFERTGNQKGTLIDFGTTFTSITAIAYKELRKVLVAYFKSLGNYVPIKPGKDEFKLDLCYQSSTATQELPSVTFHFYRADLVLKPENVFIPLDNPPNAFCLAMVKDKGELTVLGAYQQSNFKFLYDRIRWLLFFKPDSCQVT
ncbi:hypothetical protein RND81_10G206500 [Saponaria officinalis]|uniref:Peptidase A1 domain-containing protein n=1 Tax=Saponaria officinalis TaxID=3572 RepID=A0AAW1I648_SAPOF